MLGVMGTVGSTHSRPQDRGASGRPRAITGRQHGVGAWRSARTAVLAAAVGVLVVVATACELRPTPGVDPVGPGPDRPIVGVTLPAEPTDDAPSVGVIGAAGGTIAGATEGGLEYLLAVPPGALADETELSIQPLELAGPPFGDDALFAFDLQPEGLTFGVPARLFVLLPDELDVPVLGIGSFDDDGQAFHRDSSTWGRLVSMEIGHFSTARGVTATGTEQMAWAEEVARAFTPNDAVVADGNRYMEAVKAKNEAIVQRHRHELYVLLDEASELDTAAMADNLIAWVDERIEGHLLAVGGRDRLVQAVTELRAVLNAAASLPDGEDRDRAVARAEQADEALRQRWLAVFQTYLAPQCTATLLDATDAVQHPVHISAMASMMAWDGFVLPSGPDGWCVQLRVEGLEVPTSVPDEELAASSDPVTVRARYAVRTPRAAAFAGEPLQARFDEGPLRLAEPLDRAMVCIEARNDSGVVLQPNAEDGGRCTQLPLGQDTTEVSIDPSGLDDLDVRATVRLDAFADVFGEVTRDATSPRQRRTLRLETASTVLPAPPVAVPVCAVVEQVTAAGTASPEGVDVTITMTPAPGSTAEPLSTTGQTDGDGRLCVDYRYESFARPAAGADTMFDTVTAAWTDHLGRPRTTDLVVEPDWVDVRLWRPAVQPDDAVAVTEPSATSFTFAASRFSSWKAAVVRRAATPADPGRPGVAVVTPDGGTSGTWEAGGGIVVEAPDGSLDVTVGGASALPLGIDLAGPDQPTPAFRICVCRDGAVAPGGETIELSATVDGLEVSRTLTLAWDQLVTPPTPNPPPVQGEDGVWRDVAYAPERSFDPGTYRFEGALMSESRRVSGTLVFRSDLFVNGEAVVCPRLDWFGSFGSDCGTWNGAAPGLTWTISGGTSIVRFDGDVPQPFVVRRVVGALDAGGVWTENVFETTVLPERDPSDLGSGPDGQEDFTTSDACRQEDAWVHWRVDTSGCAFCA